MKLKLTLFALLVWATTYTQTTTLNTNQIRPGANGQVLQTVSGVPAWVTKTGDTCYISQDSILVCSSGGVETNRDTIRINVPSSIKAFNGLTLLNDTVKLGGLLIDSTFIDLNNNFFGYGDSYSKKIITDNLLGLGVPYNGIYKELDTTLVLNGLLNLSGFGDDSIIVWLGELNPTGTNTAIIVNPQSKKIYIKGDDIFLSSDSSSFFLSSQAILNTNWFFINTSGGGVSHTDTNSLDKISSINAYRSNGVYPGGGGDWYRKDKTWDCGNYTFLDADTIPRAQLFYGTLDNNNNVTDKLRIEVNPDEIHLRHLDYNRSVEIRKTDVEIISNGHLFVIDSHQLKSSVYPNTRDDSPSSNPQNFIYTNSIGEFKSASLGQIIANQIKNTQTGITGTTVTLPSTPLSGTLMVFKNGILLDEGGANDYTVSGTTVTFNVALVATDKIKSFYY